MNNALQAFAFDSHAVRTVMKDGEDWFVASDIAKVLSFAEAKDMTRMLDEDEKGRHIVPTPYGDQEMIIISESGLYTAILRSRKPEAKHFRKWVTAEMLPALRKTGRYALPSAPPQTHATDARLDKLIGLLEQFVQVLPVLMKAAAGKQPNRARKQMCEADLSHIRALRDTGAMLKDIVAATGFSQTQVWCVLDNKVKVQPGGRVVLVQRSVETLAAEKQAREEAQKQQGGNDLFGERA